MNGILRLLRIKSVSIIIGLLIVSITNIKAQNDNAHIYSGLYYNLKFQKFNSKIEFPSSIYALRYNNSLNFKMYLDSLQSNPLGLHSWNISKYNSQLKWYKFYFENPDTLRNSIMYKRTYNLPSPNINFHYTPSPTTWQGLGILFMGITRTVLFPTAPDYRIEP